MRYRVSHRTTYSYDDDVTDSLGIGHLVPRALPWQQVASYDVASRPTPGDLRHDVDYYGNVATYFQVTEPHRGWWSRPPARSTSRTPPCAEAALAQPWERARPLPRRDDAGRLAGHGLRAAVRPVEQPSRPRDVRRRVARRRGRPVGEAVTDLMHRIHADFDYDHTATTVTSTVGGDPRRAGRASARTSPT